MDIDAGAALVEAIKPLARRTTRPGAPGGDDAGLGGFGAIFDLAAAGFRDPILVASTDGVGTKLKIAHATGRHETIGIDLVAMCVNDVVVQGAEPLFFLDYFATSRLERDTARAVIAGIAAGCAEAGCALIGGETAEMPSLYQPGDYDLAGFAVGAVERGAALTGAEVAAGDVVLGLASSGLHSNGFSLVRHIVERAGLSYESPAPFADGVVLGEALLTPTRIYVRSCLAALRRFHEAGRGIRALAHITGGGLTENVPRILPAGLGVQIDVGAWARPPVFDWLATTGGIAPDEMVRTFNCGIGMIVVVARHDAEQVAAAFESAGETVSRIGRVVERAPGSAPVAYVGLEAAWQG